MTGSRLRNLAGFTGLSCVAIGVYQFALGTWETYGGAASEFGVAGPAYQDRIFDNAIAAGGASNWTAYDGC